MKCPVLLKFILPASAGSSANSSPGSVLAGVKFRTLTCKISAFVYLFRRLKVTTNRAAAGYKPWIGKQLPFFKHARLCEPAEGLNRTSCPFWAGWDRPNPRLTLSIIFGRTWTMYADRTLRPLYWKKQLFAILCWERVSFCVVCRDTARTHRQTGSVTGAGKF